MLACLAGGLSNPLGMKPVTAQQTHLKESGRLPRTITGPGKFGFNLHFLKSQLFCLRSIALFVILVCAGGWGLADYDIQIVGDYYVVRQGGNEFSLCRQTPSRGGQETPNYFDIIYKGINTYGHSGEIIYGTTVQRGYYIFNKTGPIKIFYDRDKWEESLDKLGVQEIILLAPHPPDEYELGLMPRINWVRVITVVVLTIVTIVLLYWGLRHVKRQRGIRHKDFNG